jgi:hypothetical protein
MNNPDRRPFLEVKDNLAPGASYLTADPGPLGPGGYLELDGDLGVFEAQLVLSGIDVPVHQGVEDQDRQLEPCRGEQFLGPLHDPGRGFIGPQGSSRPIGSVGPGHFDTR